MKTKRFNIWSLTVILITGFLFACSSGTADHKTQVEEYFAALNIGSIDRARAVISDTLTISEGDFSTDFYGEVYYEHFRWDSIFQPGYEILEMQEEGDEIVAMVASRSVRYEFLRNNPLSCERRIYFKDGKIRNIAIGECPSADWETWEARRDSLVRWVARNHQELDGFINDLSMQGAQNYMQAMEFYENAAAGVTQ
ncbi:hypothetical protein SAMN04490243_0458 [Robiginitalea myxolifaciens]|uniref:SnoaL-like domain-containing protein n=1 Tax=Robiginitalea myxolifaciens TaxID=400055 RepID=A0A1I6FQQ3_9FLAO|nr:hypothetical protein [Robiginitalea myxolifaciens]SFR32279.1 hypothetical protein SAMN04490243_0458 [Robiginitalea myxolifaciens]